MDAEIKAEKSVEKRKERIKEFLRDKYTVGLLAIIIAAFLIRVYFLIITKSQPLWWDEAEYGAMAKYFAHIIPGFEVNAQRPFLFPGLVAILFMFHFSEVLIKTQGKQSELNMSSARGWLSASDSGRSCMTVFVRKASVSLTAFCSLRDSPISLISDSETVLD